MSLLLVDDNTLFVRIASRFLASFSELRLVGSAESAEEALQKAQTLKPQIVLLDINMPQTSGLAIIPRLRRLLPEVKIVVLTLWDSEMYRRAAMEAGADDFVPKSTINTDLVPTLHRVMHLPPQKMI